MDFLELMEFFAYDIERVHEYLQTQEKKKKEKEQPQAVIIVIL